MIKYLKYFSDYAPDKVTKWETVSYDTYYERTLLEPHEPIVAAHGIDVFASVMLNSTVLENQAFEFADVLMNHWFPNCLKGPEYVCTDNILMHRTFPLDDNDNQGNLKNLQNISRSNKTFKLSRNIFVEDLPRS